MSITKYVVRRGDTSIEPVVVEKETEHSVWLPRYLGGEVRRQAKTSDWLNYFDTWFDAHRWLMVDATRKVIAAQRSLELAISHFFNVKGMKEKA